MTKTEFLDKLRRCLAQMPPEELEKQLAYYEELFDDMLEDGMSEAEAAAHLGDPAEIAKELLSELPLGTLVKSRVKQEKGWTPLAIVLVVLGFPVWFPLLVSAFAVILSLLITLWAVAISLGAVVLALGVSAIAVPIAVVTGAISGPPLILIGAALAAAGLCVLGALGIPPLFRAMGRLCRGIWRGVKSIFIIKEK